MLGVDHPPLADEKASESSYIMSPSIGRFTGCILGQAVGDALGFPVGRPFLLGAHRTGGAGGVSGRSSVEPAAARCGWIGLHFPLEWI